MNEEQRVQAAFTEVNPDKGTETRTFWHHVANLIPSFTEVNPDKGTETVLVDNDPSLDNSLQKLTPIRGRKRKIPVQGIAVALVYRS